MRPLGGLEIESRANRLGACMHGVLADRRWAPTGIMPSARRSGSSTPRHSGATPFAHSVAERPDDVLALRHPFRTSRSAPPASARRGRGRQPIATSAHGRRRTRYGSGLRLTSLTHAQIVASPYTSQSLQDRKSSGRARPITVACQRGPGEMKRRALEGSGLAQRGVPITVACQRGPDERRGVPWRIPGSRRGEWRLT